VKRWNVSLGAPGRRTDLNEQAAIVELPRDDVDVDAAEAEPQLLRSAA
jgi:hypothetical protein